MSLLDDLTLNLTKAHALLRELLEDPSAETATVAAIETLVHPMIKTATRFMIQAEARRLAVTASARGVACGGHRVFFAARCTLFPLLR
jgi:hypothetical protein